MKRLARALSRPGIERFRIWLEHCRAGDTRPPPWESLDQPASTRELPVEVELEQLRFASRLEFGKYLVAKFSDLPAEDADRDAGLWAWLSLFYADQLCPPNRQGHRRPGTDYRHVPDFDYRYRHRHLAYGPYQIYRRHGVLAFPLLSGPLHLQNTIFQEIAGRQELVANRGVIEAVMLLYFDPPKLAPKRGSQAGHGRPGTIHRLVRVLQQLDMNYDIYGLAGREILKLLPAEFDAWQPHARDDSAPG